MKLRHFYPLLGFVLPTLVIGYGFVIPKSCIAGINAQSVGVGTTVLGACLLAQRGPISTRYAPPTRRRGNS